MSLDVKTQTIDESNMNDVAQSESFYAPTPDDLPTADVVIYDGKCVFCRKSIMMLDWWVAEGQLSYLSLHDPYVDELCPDLAHDQLMKQIYLIGREDNSRHGGAEVIRYLSTRSWKLWIAAPFLHFPGSMPLWQWMYQQVAKRRYLIANKDGEPCDEEGTCSVHLDKS